MTTRALIFDLDDTLVESERLNDILLDGFLRREFGFPLSRKDQEVVSRSIWKDTFSHIIREYGIREPWEALWTRFYAEKRGHLETHRLRVASGASLMFSLPVPKALVSGSAGEEVRMMLGNAGIAREMFSTVITSDDCLMPKPHPEGFLLALEILDIPAGEAIVFEDSLVGIEAAKAGGMPAVFIGEFARADCRREADESFDTLEAAYPWVLKRVTEAGD
jgi:beta-phosphoglucomutase